MLSYMVGQRTRELGVRVALGARRLDVVGLILWQGMRVTIVGLAAGLVLSALAARYLSTLLYGVTPGDPFTFIAVPIVLALITANACLVPAWRAARLDPIRALRS